MDATHFGGVFYINLARRTDRREEIEQELTALDLPFERYNAVESSPGLIGCAYSHLGVLKTARDRGLPNVLILEDDFQPLVSKEEFWKNINAFFAQDIPYDVLMLGYNIQQSTPFNDLVCKVNEAQTTSGYVVHSRFYDPLINVIEDSIPHLQRTGKHWEYAIDQAWKQLQPAAAWYAFNTRIGKQRASYSDCGGGFMDYGV